MVKYKCICLVDDDPIFIVLANKYLQNFGISSAAFTFNNGKTAYDGLINVVDTSGALPDLILLDINMPIWDAWDFLEAFQIIPAFINIDVCVVSSSNHPDDLKRVKDYPCVKAFIEKPINSDKIKTIFDTLQ
jgi:CheY-like chemotaxis protein